MSLKVTLISMLEITFFIWFLIIKFSIRQISYKFLTFLASGSA